MDFGIIASSYGLANGGGGTSQYAAEVLADLPLLYWRLNETSGTTAFDSSGNGRSGTYVNSPNLGVRGLVQADTDTCVYFKDSTDDYVTLASSSWMNITEMTLTCVVRATLSGIQILVSRYHDPNGDRSWFLYTQGGFAKFYVRDSSSGETIVDSGVQCVLGRAYFLAAYASGAEVGIRVYDASGLLGSATGIGRAVNSSNRPFMVARSDDGASYQVDAYIDDVAFYGSVLSTARLDALAAEAMTPQPQWINRASGVSPRNGTTNHTITFPATSANSFQLAIITTPANIAVTTPGWTKRLEPYNYSELAVCTRTANSGETSLQITTSVANTPVHYVVYEFPTGTSYYDGVSEGNGPWPTLGGLPAAPTMVFAAISQVRNEPTDPPQSSAWLYSWTEDFDLMTADDGVTDGIYMTVAYKDLYQETSVTVQGPDHVIAGGGLTWQMVLFALIVP